MINRVRLLREEIENNLEIIRKEYDIVQDVLYQISLLIERNVDEERVKQWYDSNKASLEIIHEIIEKNRKENYENIINRR